MNLNRGLLLGLLCLFLASVHSKDSDDPLEIQTDDEASDDDTLLKLNPAYVDPDPDPDQKTDATNDQSAQPNQSSKSALQKALGRPRKVRQFLRRHRFQMTLALIVVAFGRELRELCLQMISKPILRDGKVVGRVYTVPHRRRLLQLAVLVYLVFAVQSQSISPSVLLLVGHVTGLGFLPHLLIGNMGNTAYVPSVSQHYTFENLNRRHDKDHHAFSKVTGQAMSREASNASKRADNDRLTLRDYLQAQFSSHKSNAPSQNTTVILDWTLDTQVSNLPTLRDQTTFLLSLSSPFDIVVRLESPGGSAANYALAAQQLVRLRRANIPVTVCVDTVAASGGYMIACTASPGRLFAAPLAIVGSIGVIAQTVNVQNLLEQWGVRPLVFKGGRDKAPVGLLGDVNDENLAKMQGIIDMTHRAFQRHVATHRPVLSTRLPEIASGDIWIGEDALRLDLVDRIVSSDEYLQSLNGTILRLRTLDPGSSLWGRPRLQGRSSVWWWDWVRAAIDGRIAPSRPL